MVRSVAIGRSVITVGVPGGTLITAGTRLSAETDAADPAALEAALAEPEERRTLGELTEGSVVTASEATDRVEQAADLLSDALAGNFVDLDRAGQVLDVLQRLDKDGRHEEWLRYARSVHGVLVLLKRWADLLRLLRTLLRSGDQVHAAGRAWAQHELGTLCLAAGDQAQAARLLERARSTRERLGDADGLAATEQSLGVLCRRQAATGGRGRWRRVALAAVALLLLVAGGVAGAVIARQDPASLSVAVEGRGVVRAPSAAIRCPDECDAELDPGTAITLTARARRGWTFAGWSGGGCEGTESCELTVRGAVAVTARFTEVTTPAGEFALSVTREGSGRVTSRPAGVDCPDDCDGTFAEDSQVDLLQQADEGWAFAGWSGGGCSGTEGCRVTMTQAQTVTAIFEPVQPTRFVLTTTTEGGGELVPPCADGCPYDEGTVVPLTATPAGENNSVAWTGCTPAVPGDFSCEVTMSENREVSARFFFAEP